MRLFRPACLALLSTVVGLGVPGVFSQQGKSAKSHSKSTSPKASAPKSSANGASKKSSAPKNSSAKSGSGKGSASATQHASSAAGKKSSGKSSASKASSRKSRRQPGQKAPTSERITEIQSALAKDGSFAGEPSGKWDDSTTAAMRRFQASHGLNPSGKLDAPTLQRLGLGSTTAGVARPTPPPGSVSRLSSSILTAPSPDDTPRQ